MSRGTPLRLYDCIFWRAENNCGGENRAALATEGVMGRFVLVAITVGLTSLVITSARGQFSNSGVPGAQQGDVHAPWSSEYLPLLPNQPIQYGSPTSIAAGQVPFYYGSGWPAWGYGWNAPYYWYDGPYYPGPIVLPPLYLPAEELYGPQAMKRFMGIDGPSAPAPAVIIANKSVPGNNATAEKSKVRISNAGMRAQAGKFMAFGDAHFANQKFNQALERYRLASHSAPDLAETYLRQGFALVAMSRYESAAKAMRRALLLQPNPAKWNLRLDDLYDENKMAKTAHLEALALAVENNPQSAELLLLLGLHLFFDGKGDRAVPVFQRCEQLGGNEDGILRGLLPRPNQPVADDGKDI
jgi:hypothetical protein